MGKVWVLDTETKGTGASMVPLERVLKKRGSEPVPGFGFRKPESPPVPPAAQPRQPHTFKVIDIMTREVLAEGADARATVDALNKVRSIVDVMVYTWDPKRERWRALTFGEKQSLWQYRGSAETPRDPSGQA
ncbi:MAG: hypothetical protein ABI323_15215 [Solirubrobacteraceae bacterium]